MLLWQVPFEFRTRVCFCLLICFIIIFIISPRSLANFCYLELISFSISWVYFVRQAVRCFSICVAVVESLFEILFDAVGSAVGAFGLFIILLEILFDVVSFCRSAPSQSTFYFVHLISFVYFYFIHLILFVHLISSVLFLIVFVTNFVRESQRTS